MSNRVHDTEHVFGAMIYLAHEEVLSFFALLAFGYVVHGADDARGPSVMLVPVEIRKPTHLYPADLPVSPLNSVLVR